MTLKGRSIVNGFVEGEVVKFDKPLVILSDIDEKRGQILGRDIKDKIVVFPWGAGSTVGSYTIYGLKYYNNLPKAFILKRAETIVAAGAIIANIPTVDKIEISKIKDGDYVLIKGQELEIR